MDYKEVRPGSTELFSLATQFWVTKFFTKRQKKNFCLVLLKKCIKFEFYDLFWKKTRITGHIWPFWKKIATCLEILSKIFENKQMVTLASQVNAEFVCHHYE